MLGKENLKMLKPLKMLYWKDVNQTVSPLLVNMREVKDQLHQTTLLTIDIEIHKYS